MGPGGARESQGLNKDWGAGGIKGGCEGKYLELELSCRDVAFLVVELTLFSAVDLLTKLTADGLVSLANLIQTSLN